MTLYIIIILQEQSEGIDSAPGRMERFELERTGEVRAVRSRGRFHTPRLRCGYPVERRSHTQAERQHAHR